MIKLGSELVWIWVAIEQKDKEIFHFIYPKNEICLLLNDFCFIVVNKYGIHSVSTDGDTWYPQACKFLNLHHHIHSSFEKSIIERTMQYIKDRMEMFDDYFPCKKNKCNLHHVKQWFNCLLINIIKKLC